MVALVFVLLAWFWSPQTDALRQAREAGMFCELGCIVAPGFTYEVTQDDLLWTARAAQCEVASVIGTQDAEAAMWALAQNFVRRHYVGIEESFGRFVQAYCACTGRKWSSEGWAYSPRITPKADANRRLGWSDIPQRTRTFVIDFLGGRIENHWPRYVFFLTKGWEESADASWIGPMYTTTHGPRSRNSYWMDQSTAEWTVDTVRIVSVTQPPAFQQ